MHSQLGWNPLENPGSRPPILAPLTASAIGPNAAAVASNLGNPYATAMLQRVRSLASLPANPPSSSATHPNRKAGTLIEE